MRISIATTLASCFGLALLALCTAAGPASALQAAAPSGQLDLGMDELGEESLDRAPKAIPLPGKDGLGPAPSPTPNKQDREDLLGGADLGDPAARKAVLARLYERLSKAPDQKAAEPITDAIEQAWRTSGSDTVDLLMSRVDALVLSAQLDLAGDMLDAVTDIAPDDAEAWYQRGIVSFMEKDDQRAVSEFRRALSLDPRHYKALRDLGMVLEQMGDKQGALDAYKQALAINPFLDRAKGAADELKFDFDGRDI
jgi:tetratricopeptide (TPR) repeat protein